MTSSSRITTGSNICAAPRARRAISKARSRPAAIRSRARAPAPIRRRRRPQTFSHTLFGKAARELGYKPFPQPSGNLSQAYTNPLGVRLGPCTYCGFCEWFGCGNYSKASPQTTILPVLVRKPNFSCARLLRSDADQYSIRRGKRATGVTFVDSSGEEWEQPADLVILSRLHVFNVQLLLLSGIGSPTTRSRTRA